MIEKEKDDLFAFLGTKVAINRIGTPEDIEGGALFLVPELSALWTLCP